MVDRLFSDVELANLYDAFCPRERRRDFDFYLPLVMAADSVLDLGCGTGTLLHEARRMGHKGYLCGLDPAIGMIEVARQHPDIEWILGDLPSANLKRRFNLIVMTGHAFQVLVEDEELRRTLNAIRVALAPPGYFAFETRNPAAREWETWPQKYAGEVTDGLGRSVTVTCKVEKRLEGGVLSFTQTYASPAWEQKRVSWSTLRFLDSSTLTRFLTEAGLVVEAQFGDWDRAPITDTCPEIITLTRLR